jgi:alkylphosphonate utilization operon protein PhnA
VDHPGSKVEIISGGSLQYPPGLCLHAKTTCRKNPPYQSKGKFMTVKDSNGTELKDGDNVTLIKDLKVKGANTTLKRGTMIKGIRLTDDEDEIDCRHEKIKGLVLRTEYVKKA